VESVATGLPVDRNACLYQCLLVGADCEDKRLDAVGKKVGVGRIANAIGIQDGSAGDIGVGMIPRSLRCSDVNGIAGILDPAGQRIGFASAFGPQGVSDDARMVHTRIPRGLL